MKYELKDRPALVELTNKREKIKRQKAERRRYFVSGCTQTKTKRLFSFFFKKEKQFLFRFHVFKILKFEFF